MERGVLDRITEFFGWGELASEARFGAGLLSILRAAD